MTPLLRLRNLRKHVGGRLLLEIDELEIPERTCIVLSGRNGAGKSTLLRILAGLEKADRGEVEFLGRQMSLRSARNHFRRNIIYLHQHPYMLDRSVWENVAFGLRRSRLPKAQLRVQVQQALEWAGLSHLARRNARQLSGGEKQRVALTRARVLSPRLLLLDEPVANMDLESRSQAFSLIRRLKTEGISTIVTSHEPYVGNVLGDVHQHLCKTGPCRYTIVRPFLYQPPSDQVYSMSKRIDTESASTERRADRRGGNAGSPQPGDHGVQSEYPKEAVTGVILAGGRAQRMGGQDKGLVQVNSRPMIDYVFAALKPQVGPLIINANRNLEEYGRFDCPVVTDLSGNFLGPLVGMASALQAAHTEYLLTVPCDSPLLPPQLAAMLYRSLRDQDAEISVAHDGRRMQPVFALLRSDLLQSMLQYIENGGRKIDTWYAQHKTAIADFSQFPEAFLNVNTPDDRVMLEQKLRDASE